MLLRGGGGQQHKQRANLIFVSIRPAKRSSTYILKCYREEVDAKSTRDGRLCR